MTHLDGQPVTVPEPVPWYPDQLAWWMTTSKNVIRKYPPFAAFQRYLVSEDRVGNISRQEVVSMIPPLLMDVRPGMTVLDLCAAPGSKAAQLREMIHRGAEDRIRKVLQSFAAEDRPDVAMLPAKDEDADLSADPDDDGRATGILIANDADHKRAQLLIHQLKRLSSPNMIVTNHDATAYPPIRLPSDNPKSPRVLKFDRILADVPCSGDGTLRKNIAVWKDWAPTNALGLHLTQVRILVRALQMLKPGGRVVYSTCSMNPVENEAVVVSAIERCGPSAVEILDTSDELPGLKRRPGLGTWEVMDKAGRVWNNWKEVGEYARSREDGVAPGRLSESMFPRPEDHDCSRLPLERCVRVYPHLQDTGGFFIVALRKTAEFKAKPEDWQKSVDLTEPINNGSTQSGEVSEANGAAPTEAGNSLPEEADNDYGLDANSAARGIEYERGEEDAQDLPRKKQKVEQNEDQKDEVARPPDPEALDSADSSKRVRDEDETQVLARKKQKAEEDEDVVRLKQEDATASGRRRKPDGPYEEPFKYIPADHPVIDNIREFYQLSPRFPSDRYMVRNALGDPAKAVYYTNALIRDILIANEGKGVKFVHGGVRMFVKQDAPSAEVCRWRIQSEGMPILQGYVGPKRVVHLHKKETLHKLLIEMFPKVADGEWLNLGEIGEKVKDIGLGCLVLRVEPEEGDEDLEAMALPLWKSFHSLNLMLPKEDRSAMLLRIFNDTSPLINNAPQKKKPHQDVQQAKSEEDEDMGLVRPGEDRNGGNDGEDGAAGEDGVAGDADDLYAIEDAPSD